MAKLAELNMDKVKEARKEAEEAAQAAFSAKMKDFLKPRTDRIMQLQKDNASLSETVAANQAEIDRLADEIRKINGEPATKPKKEGAKRIRRSEEDLKKEAQAVYDFLKSKGKTGASAGEIKTATGATPKAGETFKDLCQLIGKELEISGQKASRVYYA
jgi:glycyl-tRNA synthetase beta subunit